MPRRVLPNLQFQANIPIVDATPEKIGETLNDAFHVVSDLCQRGSSSALVQSVKITTLQQNVKIIMRWKCQKRLTAKRIAAQKDAGFTVVGNVQ